MSRLKEGNTLNLFIKTHRNHWDILRPVRLGNDYYVVDVVAYLSYSVSIIIKLDLCSIVFL